VVTIVIEGTASGILDPFGTSTDQTPYQGVGSGVIFNSAGWILTNRHVVTGAKTIVVIDAAGKTYPGTLYGVDTLADLAIIRIKAQGLPTIALGNSATLRPGDPVLAIGCPLGSYTGSVTAGIISALGRTISAVEVNGSSSETLNGLIQTDAAINLGNSGGPLIDAAGTVVGINTASSVAAQGVGFAIPIEVAKTLLAEALAGQPLTRPYLGVRYKMLPPDPLAEISSPIPSLPPVAGAWLVRDSSGPAVVSGSPAGKAGLRAGDVIMTINGKPLDRSHTLDIAMSTHRPNDQLTLTVWRAGQTLRVRVTLGSQ